MIVFGGMPGSGKSTLGRMLTHLDGRPLVTAGTAFRMIAAKRGLTVAELSSLMGSDRGVRDHINDEIDAHVLVNGGPDSRAVVDARAGYALFSDEALKVLVSCDPEVAATRLLGAERDDEAYADLDDAKRGLAERVSFERSEMIERFGVDPYDRDAYDIVVDTSRLGPRDMSGIAMLLAEADRLHDPSRPMWATLQMACNTTDMLLADDWPSPEPSLAMGAVSPGGLTHAEQDATRDARWFDDATVLVRGGDRDGLVTSWYEPDNGGNDGCDAYVIRDDAGRPVALERVDDVEHGLYAGYASAREHMLGELLSPEDLDGALRVSDAGHYEILEHRAGEPFEVPEDLLAELCAAEGLGAPDVDHTAR